MSKLLNGYSIQLPVQQGPEGGMAVIAKPNVIIVRIVNKIEEYNPNFVMLDFVVCIYF